MKKLYEKNELTFALVWIVIYCVLQSLANPLNEMIGIEYSASAAFCILQAVELVEKVWALQTACPCLPVPLLCAACGSGIGKSLERCCLQLHTSGNGLPYHMYALCWIFGGSNLPGASV